MQRLQPAQVPQLFCQLSATHAPDRQRGPLQVWCFWQSAQLQPGLQEPHEANPHDVVSVLRTQVVVSVSVELFVLQALPPQE